MLLPQLIKQKNSAANKELNNSGTLFTFLNPVSYLIARKYSKLYQNFDFKLADGWLFVIALRLIGIKTDRYSFDMTSLAPRVFKKAIETNKSIYFIGAQLREIENFIGIIQLNFPGLRIAGYRDGYFKDKKERSSAIENILNLSPDIVVAGLGVPLQEKFLADLQDTGWKGCGYTCGGFIHQTARKLNFYPRWINALHLRMPYRFVKEPHFRKRLPDYFKFIFVFIYDALQLNRK